MTILNKSPAGKEFLSDKKTFLRQRRAFYAIYKQIPTGDCVFMPLLNISPVGKRFKCVDKHFPRGECNFSLFSQLSPRWKCFKTKKGCFSPQYMFLKRNSTSAVIRNWVSTLIFSNIQIQSVYIFVRVIMLKCYITVHGQVWCLASTQPSYFNITLN